MRSLSEFVKERRKEVNLTQEEFAEWIGVALTVICKIEQGKTNLNLDKDNLVLSMFGHELAPVNRKGIEKWEKQKLLSVCVIVVFTQNLSYLWFLK